MGKNVPQAVAGRRARPYARSCSLTIIIGFYDSMNVEYELLVRDRLFNRLLLATFNRCKGTKKDLSHFLPRIHELVPAGHVRPFD